MDDPRIDDIVSMIDQFMIQQGGHMNVTVENNGTVKTETTISKTVTSANSLDCSTGNLACQVPTLFHGLDVDEE